MVSSLLEGMEVGDIFQWRMPSFKGKRQLRQFMDRTKVVHIITKLELGGAQQNTLFTVAHLTRSEYEPVLISGTEGILVEEPECPDQIFHPFLCLLLGDSEKDTELYGIPIKRAEVQG